MFEVTSICGAAGTVAHATITNSITSDNDLMDASVSVNADDVTISLAKSSQLAVQQLSLDALLQLKLRYK